MDIYLGLVVLVVTEIIISLYLCRKDLYFGININGNKISTIGPLFFIVDVIVLFIVSGFRELSVGKDLSNYIYIMHIIENMSYKESFFTFHMEPIFVFLGKTLLSIYPYDFDTVFTIVTSLLFVIFMTIFIGKESKYPLFSIYLLLTFTFYNQSMNIIRQYIGMFIVLASIYYLYNSKIKRYFLLSCTAILCHTTAILGLLMYPVYRYIKNDYVKAIRYSLYIVVIGIFIVLFIDVLVPIANLLGYTKYLSREYGEELSIGIMMNFILWLLYIVFAKQFSRFDNKYALWVILAGFTLAANIITIKFGLFDRILLYGRCAYIVSIPNFIESFENLYIRIILYVAFASVFFVYFYYIWSTGDLYETIPYYSQL